MTPAERVVVEAAIRWSASTQAMRAEGFHAELSEAVDALLAERSEPAAETEEITWAQVVEGDKIYRAGNGAPLPPDAPGGSWLTVDRVSGLPGGRRRIFVQGLRKPIEPLAERPVIVQRGATGTAVDALGSVLWSRPTEPAGIVTSESEES
jgi:hypothetical protein